MINFSVYLKGINGAYEPIQGIPVFPFSNSNPLDEMLDQASIFVNGSTQTAIKPTSEMRIDVTDGTQTKSYYYIVSSDKCVELPNGSGKYKHDISLIERTKLLEGIYCQTITFTNTSGNVYTLNSTPATPDITMNNGASNPTASPIPLAVFSNIVNQTMPDVFTLPSLNTIVEKFQAEYDKGEADFDISLTEGAESSISVVSLNQEIISSTTNPTIPLSVIAPSGTYTVNYNVRITATPVSGGTSLSDTYDVKYTIVTISNRYPLKPWTITECVNRCLDLAEPLFEDETPRYIFAPEQVEKYANILAPEFTMTECTLREQLKVIGSFIHAEPRLGGYDADGVYQENYIFFDEYGAGEEATISNKNYIYKDFSHDINEYCTHIETSASNLVNTLENGQGVITEPNANNMRTLRTDSSYVLLSEDNSYADTENRIYDIPNQDGAVLVTLYLANGGIYEQGDVVFENIDITPYIYEKHAYDNLSSYSGTYPYNKAYALYYTRGERGIKGLFFRNETAVLQEFQNYAITNILAQVTGVDVQGLMDSYTELNFKRIAFKIRYKPIYDTKFSHGKQSVTLGEKPFMRVYNQSERLIEAKWYGENIKGVAQRLGNVEQTRTYLLTNLSDIPQSGQTIDGFFISNVLCEFLPSVIKCTVSLTKDFNRLSQYVGINSMRREYEVSDEAYDRNISIKNYIVVSDALQENLITENAIIRDISLIMQIFKPSINAVNKPINAISISMLPYNDTEPYSRVELPVIASAFGNVMVFNSNYQDNYSAGKQVSYELPESASSAFWQNTVAYGDYHGRAWWCLFRLYSDIENGGYEQAKTVVEKINTPVEFLSTTGKYKLRKDSRERIAINYAIEFVTTNENIIIGSALASSCPLVNDNAPSSQPRVFFFNKNIGKFENNGVGLAGNAIYAMSLLESNIVESNGAFTISFTVPSNANGAVSWAIITPSNIETKTYSNEQGNVEEFTINTGSKILLAKNTNGLSAGATETATFQIAKTIYDR